MGGEDPDRCRKVLRALDAAVALFFVSPLVVAYWRGCWQLMDQLLFPENDRLSIFSSILIGILPHFMFCVFQDTFRNLCVANIANPVFLVVSRLYTIVFCFTCVNHWRGIWFLWDHLTGTSWQSGLLSLGLGFGLLIIANAVCNILAPPFVSLADKSEGFFDVPTLFNPESQPRRTSVWLWLVDCVFTVVVVDSLVVFVWRGGWVLLDAFLYPGKPAFSAIGSLTIGALASVAAFLTQALLAKVLLPLKKKWLKVAIEIFFYAFCFFAAVNVWRGVWKSLDHFLLPDNRYLSNWITAAAGQVVLLLCCCSNSILVRGAVPDVRETGKPGVVFAMSYITHLCRGCYKKDSLPEDLWQPTVPDGSGPVRTTSRKCNGGLKPELLNACDGTSAGYVSVSTTDVHPGATQVIANTHDSSSRLHSKREAYSLEALQSAQLLA
ncbi:uncharacterized protein LOC108681231 [Hyalella azteca]|uniref:Uncharacterized protein LOC108681231 n=1 Tax=Hyalella azteca TaxID=294128 RepID=A0A8B7PHU2_HYAAZ|nr:uncharacterized protein LOC108681231 [Hyalella azteca]